MALAVRGAAPLKPEIRLAQALSEYEAILNDDEKASFRKLRAGKPPVPSDVMKLTADIDHDNSQRWGRRCVGPRLTSMLESVQQFTTVADIIVGGSQCLIASAIWGTIKMALQLAVGFSSFFDKLSELCMQIGRSAPRIQDYGALYLAAPRLQRALCEYFCTVVVICHKAVLFTKRRFATQLSNAVLKPFNSEFGPPRTQLIELAEAIREEASLVSKQELQLERQDASAFRAMFSSTSKQEMQAAQKRRSHKLKLRFLDACSTFDYQVLWRRARKAGTSTWILEEDAYKQWVAESASNVLWCTGKLGCGKTVSTATLVQETIIRYPEAIVAHFFCSYDNSESLKARLIVGTIVRQLLNNVDPESFNDIDIHDLSSLDEETMVALLCRLTSSAGRRMFVFVDGLDECEDVELQALLESLDNMVQSHHRLHVFCSSRPDIAIKVRTLLRPGYKISSSEHNPEIADYIDAALDDRLQSGSLCLGNPSLIITIRDKLLQECQGMFLWVVFQIEDLCIENTDDAILQALDSLPRNLPETFERILNRLGQAKTNDSDMRRKIFALVTAAKRPLNAEELREAVSVIPGDTTWNPNKQINDIQKAITSCGSLLLVDEEDMTVRFAHHSVRQYVIAAAEDAGRPQNLASHSEADLTMGEICITYLNLGIFDTQLTKSGQRLLVPNDVTTSVVENALSSTSVRKVALRLLRSTKTNNTDLVRGLQAEMRRSHETTGHEHAFLTYAQNYWLVHTTRLDDKVAAIHRLWVRLLDNEIAIVKPPWEPDDWRDLPEKFLQWTIDHDHEPLLAQIEQRLDSMRLSHAPYLVLKTFAPRGKEFKTMTSRHCRLLKLPKSSAAWKLLAAVIRLFEQNLRTYPLQKDYHVELLWPLKIRDQVDSFEALLGCSGNDVTLMPIDLLNGIWRDAAAEGWLEVVTMLLDEYAVFALQSMHLLALDEALLHAAENGQAAIVDLILAQSNVDVNATGDHGRTALAFAASRPTGDSVAVLRYLLARMDIDVNATDFYGKTPLHHAVITGTEEAVKLLLSSDGIRLNIRDHDGCTAADLAKTRTRNTLIYRINTK
ncbi:hypothetical protein H2200_006079 [Cladophialophora chaetospira]|uniref:NACHT domain-containing protein n=1 Tax=Cladophialophora chaetospira TaxID=386627 RepID=A0AA39CIR3_9EURO|nr:hypothetical protein H2200_006079 [Cladophialophora chaetospira]